MKLSTSILVIGWCLLASSVSAQKVAEKPFNTWSKGEAQKIVSESPWAKTYVSTESGALAEAQQINREQGQTANRGGGNPGSVARNLGNLPVVIRLHSALVVRQATVRLQQIAGGYDKMSDSERAAFDAGRKGFLECAICKDYYVVTLTKYTDASGESVNDGIFQSITLAEIKGNVSLVNDKGETREVIQFTPAKGGGDSSIFFFKRNDENGKPLLTPESKELEFVFTNTFLQSAKRYQGLVPRKFEFPVSKMVIDGSVIF